MDFLGRLWFSFIPTSAPPQIVMVAIAPVQWLLPAQTSIIARARLRLFKTNKAARSSSGFLVPYDDGLLAGCSSASRPAVVPFRVRHRWLRRLCTFVALLRLASYGPLIACFLTFVVCPGGMLTPDVTSDASPLQAFALFVAVFIAAEASGRHAKSPAPPSRSPSPSVATLPCRPPSSVHTFSAGEVTELLPSARRMYFSPGHFVPHRACRCGSDDRRSPRRPCRQRGSPWT